MFFKLVSELKSTVGAKEFKAFITWFAKKHALMGHVLLGLYVLCVCLRVTDEAQIKEITCNID